MSFFGFFIRYRDLGMDLWRVKQLCRHLRQDGVLGGKYFASFKEEIYNGY